MRIWNLNKRAFTATFVSTTENDDSYLVYAMPTTYILDRDGVVQKRHIGFNPKTAPERIERDVTALLSR